MRFDFANVKAFPSCLHDYSDAFTYRAVGTRCRLNRIAKSEWEVGGREGFVKRETTRSLVVFNLESSLNTQRITRRAT